MILKTFKLNWMQPVSSVPLSDCVKIIILNFCNTFIGQIGFGVSVS
jgi:hypothetical protein